MKDIVLSVDVVEPELVNAVKLLSQELGRPLKGICLVHKGFVDYPGRPVDSTGLFEEVVVDYDDPDDIQRTIMPFVDRILVVTTRYEDAIRHLSQLVPFVPYINTPTESSLIWSTEKPLMRDRLMGYDQKLVPQYVKLEAKDLTIWEDLTKNFTFPVIVKPGSLWSSFLVTRCNTKDELGECLQSTFEIINSVYGRLRRVAAPSVLVEEMMMGDMYSIDAYVTQNGDITCLPLIKVLTGAELGKRGFYGHTCIVPVDLSREEAGKGYEAAKAAIRALQLRATTLHIELFQTKDGWKIIELGARIGGGREELYRESYGIEHHYNDLANRVGLEVQVSTEALKHARREDLYSDYEEGILESIEGLDEARKLESMVSLTVSARPGDTIVYPDKGGDVLVVGILSNTSKEKVEADAARLRELVRFTFQK